MYYIWGRAERLASLVILQGDRSLKGATIFKIYRSKGF